ncbi:hypothetical protein V8D89_004791 [Ganoderma adspersum]
MSSLDLDVLGTVCTFLTEYPDFLSLSLTCSVLRPLAVRNMLRNRPVVLKKVDTIFMFHDFIFADAAASRLHHLTALIVDVSHYETHPDPECSDRAIEALLAIVRQAPSLVSLELLSSANGRPLGYLDNPRVASAVGELATLQELSIGGRTEVVDFIGAVRAPLKKLALRFTRPVGGLKEWSLNSLGAALSHIAPSLEILTMTETRVRLECSPSPLGSLHTFTGIQFHTLRSLTLTSLVIVPNLSLLLELFPNLDGTVHLTPYIYDVPDSVDYTNRYDTFFRTAREQNGTAQERRSWKRLERLICDIETLFILNMRCPIGLTIVHECAPDADPGMQQCLVESLRDHPPARLNLQVTVQCDSEEQSLGRMIPPEAAATLTHLTLCVKYNYDSSPDPTPSGTHPRWNDVWRDTLLPALGHLHSLTHFRLVFHCEAWWRSCDYYPEPGPHSTWSTSQDPFLEDLRPSSKFDFSAVASTIVAALPSLRYCFLTSSAWVAEMPVIGIYSVVERWRESHAWRAAHVPSHGTRHSVDGAGAADTVDTQACGTRRELVELHEDVAETIMEREDLVLTTDEESALR